MRTSTARPCAWASERAHGSDGQADGCCRKEPTRRRLDGAPGGFAGYLQMWLDRLRDVEGDRMNSQPPQWRDQSAQPARQLGGWAASRSRLVLVALAIVSSVLI